MNNSPLPDIWVDDAGGGPAINYPEKRLIAAVVLTAVDDAFEEKYSAEARDFLFGPRVEPFLEFLNIDPDAFRESIAMSTRSH